ncbi:MAG: hypothetical protein F4Y31_11420 [Gammaproteobacteria bacterium]|nr:hypothetical protein [Gammaproteobacteria bacterium]MYF66504.1 hypothetical protein [Gammaproteobacteria bacterium]MYK37184.1 hypothetical protein [Gammaproteobacteria bacterium]
MDYYVNKNAQESGDHEVHTSACNFLPSPEFRIYLGRSTNCREAVAEAWNHYHRVDGCYHCSTACHRH